MILNIIIEGTNSFGFYKPKYFQLYGIKNVKEYYTKIKKEHPNFKVILGNEIYLCRDGLNAQNYIKGEDRYYHHRNGTHI